ncbi:hypothetical protein BDK92_2875 [Micromonospora pisi]|uniref:PPE family protein n=1 Tax=Micromonospora pisi TaxID=589240 RepID=A0A495JI14_9ACTN|nr:hypothetical protein [Micromonospora pisi]RKR88547.1 hypothetical protein BDK92_2875 [Micromonospora pisi]
MLIADAGGDYSGSTNWFNYDVKQMWKTLENQETDGHWQRVAGWRRTHELAGTHLSRLRAYREGLIQAWPPEKSAASKAYVERLDYLIDSVEQSFEAAVANRDALSGATGAISDARRQLKSIHEEYVRKLAAQEEYERKLPSASATPSPTPTPSPSPGPAPTPPVSQAELDRLNNRARSIMYGLSSELVQAQAQLRQPPPYQGRPQRDDYDPDVYGGGSPPTIPPVVPVPTTTGTGPSMPAGAGSVQHVVPAPTAPSVGPVLGGNGPTLGSAAPVAPTAPTPSITPPVITPTPSPTPGIGTGFPPALPPTPGGFGTPYPGALGTTPMTGGLTKPAVGGVANVPRAMAPGGMIGGMPTVGQPGVGVSPVRQINPVGGMIGGGGGMAGGTTQMGGAGQRSVVPPGGRAGQHRGEEASSQHWDPDNPWATDEGVAPVMRAPRDAGRIDPGPAIGFDR